MRSRAVFVVLAVAILFVASAGCVKRDTVVEMQPVAGNLSAYWTCAVTFASDGRGEDANEAFTFVPWFEGRVRERGVFEPLARDEGQEAEVTLKLEASRGDDDVTLRLLVIDTKTKGAIGELEAHGTVDATAADAGDASESKRILALRHAADQIILVLKEKRRVSMSQARHAPPPPPVLPDGPPVAGSATCITECHPPAAATSNHDEQYRVSAGLNATMKELRSCLDSVGAQLVEPTLLLRFSPDGRLRHMRVDVGGFEHLGCIENIKSRPPRSVYTTRATMLRCEYRCTVS